MLCSLIICVEEGEINSKNTCNMESAHVPGQHLGLTPDKPMLSLNEQFLEKHTFTISYCFI